MSNNSWLAPKPCQKYDPCEKHDSCEKHDHEPHPEIGCCCKNDMKKALKLLFDPTVNPAVLSNQFAFIGKKFLVGASLELVPVGGDLTDLENDNITDPSATITSINPCQSDSINISASGFYYEVPTDDPATQFIPNPISKASLCDLDAIAFNYDNTNTDVPDFEGSLKALLRKEHPCHHFEDDKCCCVKDDTCCCGKGIYKDIYTPYSFGTYVNISAGTLALYQAKVLGRVGNILVLASSADGVYRIYFICLESVGFYGTEIYS